MKEKQKCGSRWEQDKGMRGQLVTWTCRLLRCRLCVCMQSAVQTVGKGSTSSIVLSTSCHAPIIIAARSRNRSVNTWTRVAQLRHQSLRRSGVACSGIKIRRAVSPISAPPCGPRVLTGAGNCTLDVEKVAGSKRKRERKSKRRDLIRNTY